AVAEPEPEASESEYSYSDESSATEPLKAEEVQEPAAVSPPLASTGNVRVPVTGRATILNTQSSPTRRVATEPKVDTSGLQEKLDAALEAQAKAEASASSLQTELRLARREAGTLSSNVVVLNRKLDTERSRVGDLETQLRELTSDSPTNARLQNYIKQVQLLSATLQEYKAGRHNSGVDAALLKEKEDEILKMSKQIATFEAKVTALEDELSTQPTQDVDMAQLDREKTEQAMNRVAELSAVVDLKEVHINELEGTIVTMSDIRANQQSEINRLRTQITRLEIEFTEVVAAAGQLPDMDLEAEAEGEGEEDKESWNMVHRKKKAETEEGESAETVDVDTAPLPVSIQVSATAAAVIEAERDLGSEDTVVLTKNPLSRVAHVGEVTDDDLSRMSFEEKLAIFKRASQHKK
ncbi:hypothetical protein KIPB_007413, partial [Kipferlia bialata]